ncbi:MAG: hypothetical protein OXG97_21970 [Candidatus Poribacteria bacterium]|nr:hypothetical protein [Candidatus Poribacteria bacterium]
MRKRRKFTPEFKAKVVLEALRKELYTRNCVGDITSAKINSRSGSVNFLKMRKPSLDLQRNHPRKNRSGSRTWRNRLGN